jgi:hypothetical protein
MGYPVERDWVYSYASGSGWNTASGVNPKIMTVEVGGFGITMESTDKEFDRAMGYRTMHEDNSWQDTGSNIPGATFKAVVTPEFMFDIMPCLFQHTTGSMAARTSSINAYLLLNENYANLPLPTENQGFFQTLVRNSPSSSDDVRLNSAIMKSCKLNIDRTADNGWLMADTEWIGRGYSQGISAGTASLFASMSGHYDWANIKEVSYNGSNLTPDFISMEINITNNAKFVGDIPSSEVVFPKWEIGGAFKMVKNAFTDGMILDSLKTDTAQFKKIKLAFGTSATSCSAEGDLIIDMHSELTGYSIDYTEGEIIDFTFKAGLGTVASGEYAFSGSFMRNA